MAGEEMEEAKASHMKVKEVKNEIRKATTEPEKRKGSRLSFFPLPHDHLDDIFLSSGGME
jgi:hypothetical protein